MSNEHLILRDPEIMGGTPCIKGTRITVYAIAARVNGGDPISEILDEYPYITHEQVNAALDYAARIPFEENPDGRPPQRCRPGPRPSPEGIVRQLP